MAIPALDEIYGAKLNYIDDGIFGFESGIYQEFDFFKSNYVQLVADWIKENQEPNQKIYLGTTYNVEDFFVILSATEPIEIKMKGCNNYGSASMFSPNKPFKYYLVLAQND